jgi:hypothetical protein
MVQIEPLLSSPMMSNAAEISKAITFEEAITLTQSLLDQLEQSTLKASAFEEAVAKLIATQNGARGFFVAFLTDSRALIDPLMPTVIPALQSTPEMAPELLVKNLAMSTAMEITHRRNSNLELAAQSAQVQRRTTVLLDQLGFHYVKTEAEGLWQAVTENAGTYAPFLKRWGYDAEQQTAIAQQLQAVFPEVSSPSQH